MFSPINPAAQGSDQVFQTHVIGAASRIGERHDQRLAKEVKSVQVPQAVRYTGWPAEPYVLMGITGLEKETRAIADVLHFMAEAQREGMQGLSRTLPVGNWQDLLPRVSDYLKRINEEMETSWDQLHVPSRTAALLPLQQETEQALTSLSETVGPQMHAVGLELVVAPEGPFVSMDVPHFMQVARENPGRLAATLDGAAMAVDAVADHVHQEAVAAHNVLEPPADWAERLGKE